MQKCKIWFCAELVLLVIAVFAVIMKTVAADAIPITDIFSTIIQVYFLVVVYAFIEELKTNPENTV